MVSFGLARLPNDSEHGYRAHYFMLVGLAQKLGDGW